MPERCGFDQKGDKKSDFGLKRGRKVKKSNFSFKKGGERVEKKCELVGRKEESRWVTLSRCTHTHTCSKS